MYPKDIYRNSRTKSSKFKNLHIPALLVVSAGVLIYLRFSLGMSIINNKLLGSLLTLILLLIYINVVLSVYRTYIFKEKKKIKVYKQTDSASSLNRYNSLNLKDPDISTYYFGQYGIYMPEIKGYKTCILKLTHLSHPDLDAAKKLFEDIFNLCMNNNLYCNRITLPVTEDLPAFKYAERVLRNANIPKSQLARANAKLDYNRTICENNKLAADIIQITSMDAVSNYNFTSLIKLMISTINNQSVGYSLSVLSKEEIIRFIGEFFFIPIVNISMTPEEQITQATKNAIILHLVRTEDGNTYEFAPVRQIQKYVQTYRNSSNKEVFLREALDNEEYNSYEQQ